MLDTSYLMPKRFLIMSRSFFCPPYDDQSTLLHRHANGSPSLMVRPYGRSFNVMATILARHGQFGGGVTSTHQLDDILIFGAKSFTNELNNFAAAFLNQPRNCSCTEAAEALTP
ncbi:unnamed protein product [Polarella glacialis]|uniref:Uncharacterized protein n=1 Tax=Polarella glacialis TaxID=89957 RepID=A0A813K278_POLGL|nr:unnamed protein product [Polarella glacialis]